MSARKSHKRTAERGLDYQVDGAAARSSRAAGKKAKRSKPKGPAHFLAALCDAVLHTARAAGLPEPAPRTDATPARDVAYVNAQQALVGLRTAARAAPSADLENVKRAVRAAMEANGLTTRPVHAVYETMDSVTTLSRVCSAALQTAREQKAEIDRLKLLLDTKATAAIDAQLLDLLKHMSYHDPVERVLLVRGPDAGRALWAELCVKQGASIIPYKRARFGASTLHEAAASLLHDIDPRFDAEGMCQGLRKLHVETCSICHGTLRVFEGFVACDPCGKVWSTPDLSLVSAPSTRHARAAGELHEGGKVFVRWCDRVRPATVQRLRQADDGSRDLTVPPGHVRVRFQDEPQDGEHNVHLKHVSATDNGVTS